MNILHKSIDMLISNNFTIVRVGRHKNKLPINFKNKVVDLPSIRNIPDIFDIWIFKNIHLHIGDCSGPDGLPTYFDKPSLILNSIFPQEGLEWAQGFSHPADLKWSNGKLLTLWDLLNLNLTNKNNIFFERKNLLEFGIEYVPLNENNILESVTEALKLSFYKNTIQEQYWKTCKIWDKIYSKDFPKNKKHYKRSFIFKHPKFLLSKSYLKNKSFDWSIPYKSSKS